MSISLEVFGDRWSLLIIRDLMVRGLQTFKEFQEAGEGIATNILADRLQKLQATGIISAEAEERDGRRVNYRLTEKGIDPAPVMLELLIWGGAARGDGGALRSDRANGEEPRTGPGASEAAVARAGPDSADTQMGPRWKESTE